MLRLIGFLSLLLAAHAPGQIVPPPNNAFSNRIVLSGVETSTWGTNVYATSEWGEPRHAGIAAQRSVWWSWEAPLDGILRVGVTNSGSPEKRWAVYIGTTLTNLSVVASNSAATNRAIEAPVQAGTRYEIAVDQAAFLRAPSFHLSLALRTLLFAQPAADSRLPIGIPVSLVFTNTDGLSMAGMEVFASTNRIAAFEGPPFTTEWTPASVGRVRLTAVGTNVLGERRESAELWVTVVPANDHFASAFSIPSAVTSFQGSAPSYLATAESGEPDHAGRTVTRSLWWRWQPAYSGRARFLVPGENVWLAVYTGDAVTNLTTIAATGTQADLLEASFEAVAGMTYFIALDTYTIAPEGSVSFQMDLTTLRFVDVPTELRVVAGDDIEFGFMNFESDHPIDSAELVVNGVVMASSVPVPGTFMWSTNVPGQYTFTVRGTNSLGELRVSDSIAALVTQVNDNFSRAMEIASLPDTVGFAESSTSFATHEPGEPLHLGNVGMGSVWFTWVAPWSGSIYFSTAGSESASYILVYQGSTLTNLVPLTDGYSSVATVVEGERYYIAAEALWGNEGHVRISIHPPPPNDNFADAFLLEGLAGTFLGTNISASSEPGEPVEAPVNHASIWWRWTAPATGDFSLSTAESLGISVQSAVYQGDSVTNLVTVVPPRVTSSRDPGGSGGWIGTIFRVHEGRTYHFRFAGGDPYYGIYGAISGSFVFTPLPDIPINDDFAGRIVVSGLSNRLAGDNTLASLEPGEPWVSSCDSPGRTLWWTYIAPSNGTLRLSWASAARPVWTVYRGETLAGLERIAASCESPIYLEVQAGDLFQITLDGAFGGLGEVALDVVLFTAPPNDDFANRIPFGGTNFVVSGTLFAATLEPGEPKAAPGSPGLSVWYSWAAPAAGRVRLTTGSAMIIPAVAAYTGPGIGHLTRIQAGEGNLSFMAIEGEVYHLQLDSAGYAAGDFTLSLEFTPFVPATNDHFANAITLKGGWVEGFGCISDATMEPGEPAHNGAAAGKSLWWRWQVPQNGSVGVGNSGSLATNVTFAIYKGSSVEALTLVAKGLGGVTVPSVAGGTILYIAAAVDASTEGDVVFYAANQTPFSGTPSFPVPGNVLCESSFEGTGLNLSCWHLSTSAYGGGYVGERGGADGTTWIALNAGVRMWQDFATIPGRQYSVRFAFRPDFGAPYAIVRVRWDNRDLGLVTSPVEDGGYWHWPELSVTASNATSRLTVEVVEGIAGFDAFSVVPVFSAPAIVTPPESISTFPGGTATFLVGVNGSPVLQYQWYFNDALIAGETAKSLTIDPVTLTNLGSYHVTISNAYGVVTSAPVQLVVEETTDPLIVLQPYGDTIPAGGWFALSVGAVASAPLHYQWTFNGLELPGATNRQFILSPVTETNAGIYAVRVSSGYQSVWSLPARLIVETNYSGGGALLLGNEFPDGGFTHYAWIYDTDGITRLSGPRFVAQLYAGPSIALIRAVGQPRPFRTGFAAGLIDPDPVVLPNVAPLSTAFVQVRVWESEKGSSYEEARALGSRFGKSELLEITPGLMPDPPPIWGLQSFVLRAGLPQFVAGRIDLNESHPDGTVSWKLIGEAGYRYAIEKRADDFVWRPLLVLTNVTGTALFTDPSPPLESLMLYRARILE